MDENDRRTLYELQRQVDALKRDAEEAKRLAAEVQTDLEQWRAEQQKEEAKRLRTALMAAAGIIMTLGGFVWAEIVWPVIRGGMGE